MGDNDGNGRDDLYDYYENLRKTPELTPAGQVLLGIIKVGYGEFQFVYGLINAGKGKALFGLLKGNAAALKNGADIFQGPQTIKEGFDNILEGTGLDDDLQEFVDDVFDKRNPEEGEGENNDAEEGRSKGEPHLSTYDGLGYSFQGLGEFILTRGDDLEVQIRYAEIRPGVTVAKAVAMQIGDDVVGLYGQEDFSTKVYVNENLIELEEDESIAVGDGSIYFDGRVYVVSDGKGNGFITHDFNSAIGRIFNLVRPFIDGAQEGEVIGLLGNDNGDPSDDVQNREGEVLGSGRLAADVLYGEFADAWRVTEDESLLVYGPGESTETFTDRDFPFKIVTIDDFDPAVVEAAREIVRGLGVDEGSWEFETTVFDIVVTGNADFASAITDLSVEDLVEPELVVDVNLPPIIADGLTSSVDEDGAVTIDVLAGASDPEHSPLTLVSGSDPNGGTVTVEDGQLFFAPASHFEGETALTFLVRDDAGNEVEGSVLVSVAGTPDDPVAEDDVFSVAEGGSVSGSVLADNGNGADTDADGDALSVTLVDGVENGTLELNADGTFDYTPTADFNGTDTFIYEASDGNSGTDQATVTITVNSVNDAPVAGDDGGVGFETDEDSAFTTASVLGNDTDVNGDTLSVAGLDTIGTRGLVTDNGDGTFYYDPNGAFESLGRVDSITDSFSYTVSDGNDGTDTSTVTVTVNGVNDDPSAGDDTDATGEDVPVDIGVLGNDTDVDGDTLTVSAVGAATNGTTAINPDGTVRYIPDAGFSGSDAFTYSVSDGLGGEATATVNVTVEAAPEEGVFTFSLVDTNTDVEVAELFDGAVISGLTVEPPFWSIVADFVGDGVAGDDDGSIAFKLFDEFGDLVQRRTERAAPFALFGDRNGAFSNPSSPLENGDYTLEVTAFGRDYGRGEELGSQTISFSLEDTLFV